MNLHNYMQRAGREFNDARYLIDKKEELGLVRARKEAAQRWCNLKNSGIDAISQEEIEYGIVQDFIDSPVFVNSAAGFYGVQGSSTETKFTRLSNALNVSPNQGQTDKYATVRGHVGKLISRKLFRKVKSLASDPRRVL